MQALGGAWDDHLAQYPAFKAVDNSTAVKRYHMLNPSGLCIHRHYYPQDAHAYIGKDPHGAAQRWCNENASVLKALPFALHEGFNEAGSDPLIVAFEIERVTLMAQLGVRACVLNLSTGTYNDDTLWQREDIRKLAALVEQTGGAIGLHCYGECVMSSNCGPLFWKEDGQWSGGDPFPSTVDFSQCWLALRIGRVREVLASVGLKPMLVATELGLDDDSGGVYKPFGIKVRGWKDCVQVWQRMGWLNGTTPEAFYRKQLQWFCDVAQVTGLVYAFNDQTPGLDGKPGVFDVQGVL